MTTTTTADVPEEAQLVVDYWFGAAPASTAAELEAKLNRWFGDARVAQEVRDRFADLVVAAESGKLEEWERTPVGTLALLVVLDQFVRSYYGMNDGRAFSQEKRAARLALELFNAGVPDEWCAEKRFFALVPLGHAEDLALHERAMAETRTLIKRAPLHLRPMFETIAAQLVRFMQVIERFGRFPHRNAALGRESTPEEEAFLRTWEVKHPVRDYSKEVAVSQGLEGMAGDPEDS